MSSSDNIFPGLYAGTPDAEQAAPGVL